MMPQAYPVLINGQETHLVDVRDRGFQYGDGVFTTLPVFQGQPAWLEHHLARLERDGRRLSITCPTHDVLRREVESLLRRVPDAGVLKIQLTRGTGGRGYACRVDADPTRVISLHPSPQYPPSIHREGVQVRVCQTRLGINPALAGLKHTNRLEQILARAELQDGPCLEGITLDHEGCVIEGTCTNLFLVRNGVIHTPLLDRCGVQGVMRDLLIEEFGRAGLPVRQTRPGLPSLYEADEVFLSNSVIGVWSVRCCDQRNYPQTTYAGLARAFLQGYYPYFPV